MKNTGTLIPGQIILDAAKGPCKVEAVSEFGARVKPKAGRAFYISSTSEVEILEDVLKPTMEVPALSRRHF